MPSAVEFPTKIPNNQTLPYFCQRRYSIIKNFFVETAVKQIDFQLFPRQQLIFMGSTGTKNNYTFDNFKEDNF